MNKSDINHCPCGTGKIYQNCCELIISGKKAASSPEELMRSRYTAYTQANIDYIANTMKPPASDSFDAKHALHWSRKAKWIKLEIIETSVDQSKGYVEFIAYYDEDKKRHALHELSEFDLIDGNWFYVDGNTPKIRPATREALPGRNEPCSCGSGKKFKKCCSN